MKSTSPPASPEAYVQAPDGWRRELVAALRSEVRSVEGLEEVIK